ncbi:uncharacterized protein LOC110033589 [Phalaenopsis equestris]|uniref:uncharacterized protein LOC110033589 n=1 Tax=Phalaenopsis equestris TaxID=78828 RepID=UPI0009E2DE64|nr:uncharacterized protein LOC110033589 [Phalaenopsis equestris]
MQEEQRREEATVKWKQLYLAIKIELDDLIRRTREGDRYCCRAKGLTAQGLLRELKAKNEALEAFGTKFAAMKKEGARREREIDILRQSLRILTSSMGTRGRRSMKNANSYITVEAYL